MNELAIAVVTLGLGCLAWGMLVASNWLLRDKDERLSDQPASRPENHDARSLEKTFHNVYKGHLQMDSHEKD
jgi:hypothetical protein